MTIKELAEGLQKDLMCGRTYEEFYQTNLETINQNRKEVTTRNLVSNWFKENPFLFEHYCKNGLDNGVEYIFNFIRDNSNNLDFEKNYPISFRLAKLVELDELDLVNDELDEDEDIYIDALWEEVHGLLNMEFGDLLMENEMLYNDLVVNYIRDNFYEFLHAYMSVNV